MKRIYNNVVLLDNGLVVDETTGEVVAQRGKFIVQEESERRKGYYQQKQSDLLLENIRLRNELDEYRTAFKNQMPNTKSLSSFTWLYFREQEDAFPKLKSHDVCRLVFLSTFCDYKTNLLTDKGVVLEKRKLYRLMGLNYPTFASWLDLMIECKYLSLGEQGILFNRSTFEKGALRKGEKLKAIRLMVEPIREAYMSITPSDHYKMGFVFRTIPYMDVKTNQIVGSDMSPLSREELANNLGYSRRQCYSVLKGISKISFGENGDLLIAEKKRSLYINPKLIFGDSADKYELACDTFNNIQKQGRKNEGTL